METGIARLMKLICVQKCMTILLMIASVNASIAQKFKMTTLSFGGNGVCFTSVKDQLTVMAGGRGSATFNNRYTIGGGGWGMMKGVSVESDSEGIYKFAKMGYGGVDFGYLLLPGENLNIGARMLVGGGAVFIETVPETKDKYFRLFPVAEPAIYAQLKLNRIFKLEAGAAYRMITGTNQPYVTGRDLSGFSCYIGFLIKAAN